MTLRSVGIAKGEVGTPGALNGSTDEAAFLGDIQINCGCGIYGAAQFDGKPLETGDIKPARRAFTARLRATRSMSIRSR
ncbi:MAG: SpoIVB peptidase S55 domain-containing protein [Subdoligranulum sp.]